MKAKSREINIFSMSALDLFASALGAFIIIAITLMPFYPNTGDSPERIAEIKKQLEAEQQARAEVEAELERAEARGKQLENQIKTLTRQVAEARFPDVDLVIAIDTTGSMEDEIHGLAAGIGGLVLVLGRLAPSVAVGVVEFKDRCESVVTRSHELGIVTPRSAAFDALQRFLDSLKAESLCNEDRQEAVYQGLAKAVAMPWRGGGVRPVIAVITDNPAYPDRRRASIDMARAFAARWPGGAVSGINTGEASGREYLQELSAAGAGAFIDGGESMTSALLLALMK